MRIVIVGAGNTGVQLAKYLIQEKHDVSIIESDEERAKHISNRLDCLVVHEKGNNLSALGDAGIKKADALVCVTGSDEINMIICGLAASLLGEGKLLKIARVRNDDYLNMSFSDGRKVLGIDHFIHPSMEVARSIIKAIEHGVMGDIFSFTDTQYEMGAMDIAAGSALDGMALTEYRKLVTHESIVTLIERNDEVMLPSGSTVIKSGDRVHILSNSKNLPEIYRFAGDVVQKPIRKIGIAGGGRLGSMIAEGLLDDESVISGGKKSRGHSKKKNVFSPLIKVFALKKRRVIIIEKDSKLCAGLAARFPEALILNEDISDESFANEEALDDLD